VVRWIEAGQLAAYRTPGGHRRIRREDIRAFSVERGIPLVEPDEAGRVVLVVDDEPVIRAAMIQLIQKLSPDIPVLTAEDAFQAGQLFARYQPALVFLDLRLPGLDGFQFYEHIRAEDRQGETAVVAITGMNDSDLHQRLRRSGIQRLLRKPFTSRAVHDLLKEFVPAY